MSTDRGRRYRRMVNGMKELVLDAAIDLFLLSQATAMILAMLFYFEYIVLKSAEFPMKGIVVSTAVFIIGMVMSRALMVFEGKYRE